jgi:hypothetical protein
LLIRLVGLRSAVAYPSRWPPLRRLIFQQYSKTGAAGSSTAAELFTLAKSELMNLSMDCGLATPEFTQTRVINLFERANQVDASSTVNKNGKASKAFKARGDGGLQVPTAIRTEGFATAERCAAADTMFESRLPAARIL